MTYLHTIPYQFCHCQINLPKIWLLLCHSWAQTSSAAGRWLYNKTPKPPHPGLLIFTGFPCASQTGILTVLQTSFHPPTFVHNFPFFGIFFFPFSAYWNLTVPLKLAQEMNSDYALVFHKVLILLPFYVLVCVANSSVKL